MIAKANTNYYNPSTKQVRRYSADYLAKNAAAGQLTTQFSEGLPDQAQAGSYRRYLDDAESAAGGDSAAAVAPTNDNGDAAKRYYDSLDITSPTAEEQAAIKEQTRKDMQGQLDAIDAAYSTILSDIRLRNTNDAGRTRALDARSGLLGSDFGSAHADTTERIGGQRIALAQKEQAAEKAKVMGAINDRAMQQIEMEKAANEANATKYFEYLKGSQTDARNNALTLAKSGVTHGDLSADEYRKLLDQTGWDELTLDAQMNNASQIAMQYQIIEDEDGNKKILAIGQDAKGNIVSKTYDSGITGGKKPEIFNGVPYVKVTDPATGEISYKPVAGVANGNVTKLMDAYPDAGIDPTDTFEQAQAKLGRSASYRKDVRIPGGGSGGGDEKLTVDNLQATLDNYALDKEAGRAVPAWAEEYLSPLRKMEMTYDEKGNEAGEAMKETGQYAAKKVSRGSAQSIIDAQQQYDATADMRDVDFVTMQVSEDMNAGASWAEAKRAALSAGVPEDVFAEAARKISDERIQKAADGFFGK